MTAPITRPCWYCERPCDVTSPYVLRMVRGWAYKRDAGGVNRVVMGQPQQMWAHKECVDTAMKGRTGQEALFPEDT